MKSDYKLACMLRDKYYESHNFSGLCYLALEMHHQEKITTNEYNRLRGIINYYKPCYAREEGEYGLYFWPLGRHYQRARYVKELVHKLRPWWMKLQYWITSILSS